MPAADVWAEAEVELSLEGTPTVVGVVKAEGSREAGGGGEGGGCGDVDDEGVMSARAAGAQVCAWCASSLRWSAGILVP